MLDEDIFISLLLTFNFCFRCKVSFFATHKFNQIDLNILLFILLDSKTYNSDIDNLMNDFYLTSKNDIEKIRNDFLDFLYSNYYKKISSSSSILFHWYKSKSGNLNNEDIIYYLLKKNKFKLKNKNIIDNYASLIASNMILFSIYTNIYKNYVGYNFQDFRPLIQYIIKNQENIIKIIHNNKLYNRIKLYFEDFIHTFDLNDLYMDFCKFYNLNLKDEAQINFYFNFYPSLISNNDQKFQAGMLINKEIYLSGLSDFNTLKFVFLHEIAHFYDIKLENFNEIFVENSNLYLLLKNTICVNSSKINGKEININNLKERLLYLLEENSNVELLKELIADLSVYNFFCSSDKYNYLIATFKYNITLFVDKENYSYSLPSNLYYELIKYIKDKIDIEKIAISEIMFNENSLTRNNILKRYFKDFIDNKLSEILNEGHWIIGE